jgi:DHA3 family tetracycline resistance protein-like MFS transporter
MALIVALKHRPFALLWVGQTVSVLGIRFYDIALAWWVLEKTGSAAAMATVLIFSRIPMLFFVLAGGAIVDRLPRARVMLVSRCSLGIILILTAWLDMNHSLELWHFYAVSALFGLSGAFLGPASAALLPEITPRDMLPSANSLTGLGREASAVIGPMLAGLVVGAGGASVAFAISAFSFFFAAILFIPLLKLSVAPVPTGGSSSLWADAREGIRLVAGSPWLWMTIALATLSNVTVAGPVVVAMPFLVKEHLRMGAEGLGSLYAMMSVGALLAAAVMGSLGQLRRRGVKAYLAWIIMCLQPIVLGISTSPIVSGAAAIGYGASATVFNLIWLNTLQTLIPQEKMGRVSSVDLFGSDLLTPVGFAIVGSATAQIGPSLVFIIGGAISAVVGVIALLVPDIRKLD